VQCVSAPKGDEKGKKANCTRERTIKASKCSCEKSAKNWPTEEEGGHRSFADRTSRRRGGAEVLKRRRERNAIDDLLMLSNKRNLEGGQKKKGIDQR